VKGLSDKVGAAAEAVTTFINSPEAKQTFLNLNAALTDLRVVLARIDGNVGPISAELKQTLADAQAALKSLDATAATTQRFIAAQGSVGDEATGALRQLADAAAALERLADAITRNPSSLIVGKKKPDQP
jgi:paraquat-inducible protein B